MMRNQSPGRRPSGTAGMFDEATPETLFPRNRTDVLAAAPAEAHLRSGPTTRADVRENLVSATRPRLRR